MDLWKLFALKLASFLLFTTLGGFGLLRIVELVENAWKSKNWKKKWFAMSAVVAIYLALKGWFQ